jgi:hypothetical protein
MFFEENKDDFTNCINIIKITYKYTKHQKDHYRNTLQINTITNKKIIS